LRRIIVPSSFLSASPAKRMREGIPPSNFMRDASGERPTTIFQRAVDATAARRTSRLDSPSCEHASGDTRDL